ncbi:MAG TPA: hypothetical protein ENL03_06735, partial [Phycisphaerae bacterium]|nr:hypothetical protein [Phycisphaerae bacterium]
MSRNIPLILCLLALVCGPAASGRADAEAGDLHFRGESLTSYSPATGKQILVFDRGFSLSIGVDKLSSDVAVVWLSRVRGYRATVYMQGDPAIEKAQGSEGMEFKQTVIQTNHAVAVEFIHDGGIYVTAEQRETTDPRESEPYLT